MRISVFILCLLSSVTLLAQSHIEGQILDAVTGLGIPYVNIGIPAQGMGTVSNEDGIFELRNTAPDDLVRISSIGYESKEIKMSQLLKNSTIRLQAQVHSIPTIELSSKQFGEEQILGEKFEERHHSVGFGSQQLGTEIAARIEINKETLIKSAHFTLNHAKGDSLLFRVNIYEFKDGVVGKNLIPENVLLYGGQESGTLNVDLTDYQVITDQDVLLSLEWIKDDNGKGNTGITFRSKKTRSGKHFYMRQTSHAPFLPFHKSFPYAPKFLVGFYLVAKQV